MQGMDPIGAREAEITRLAESKREIEELREHLKEIVEGPAFRGSHRSGQFLRYIVDQSIDGRFESLKERLIGVKLFGRSPSYDTGVDAIVRVTASEVRRRLLQHYGGNGTSRFRISLLSGSYIPEITRSSLREAPSKGAHETADLEDAPAEARSPMEQSTPPLGRADPAAAVPLTRAGSYRLLLAATLLSIAGVGIWTNLHNADSRAQAAQTAGFPWADLFSPSHSTHLITSDPNIVFVQEITGSVLTVSDYANHKYIPDPGRLKPETLRFCQTILWGDNSAGAVDAPIAASLSALVLPGPKRLDVRPARSIRLSDLKTDDNFILLGSPRSNPWASLFSDQLDFQFTLDQATHQEIILNRRPRSNEAATYVPTAQGWATGQSYAIIALVQNPDQNGQVMLLAGATGEGTEAAGKLATDLPRFSSVLERCGIPTSGPLRHFEVLLRLNTMAESPSNIDVAGCHILPGIAGQKV